MQVIYYYYYLFYTRILREKEPLANASFALSFSQALLVIYTINTVGAHLFCKFLLGKWLMVIIAFSLIGINYLYYIRQGKGRDIVEKKPKFFASHKLSIVLTVIYAIVTTSFLFWVADYIHYVIESC